MVTNSSALAQLSDRELLARTRDAARDERMATAHLIALLMEVDTRRLYLGESCSSLFTYCTQVLHLSEHAAYNRIETARAARRFPVILELIESAAVTLTAVRLLAPHLTEENHGDVLECARHKSKREVELLVAALGPRADVPSTVRKLPTPAKPDVPSSAVPRVNAETTASFDTAPLIPATRAGRNQASCARALQDSVHGQPRDLRAAASSAGPDEAHVAQRRSCDHF